MHRSVCRTVFAVATLALGSLAAAEITGEGHRFIAAQDGKHIAIVNAKGEIEWSYNLGAAHDAHLLPNGNLLFQTNYQTVIEMKPDAEKKIVWKYDSSKQNRPEGERVEVHAVQRLANGNTMIVESSPSKTVETEKDGKKVKSTKFSPTRIIEVDTDGKIAKEVILTVKHESTHSATRNARKLDDGHYLVAHESDGTVREYDEAGKVIWEYEVPLFGKKANGDHGPNGWGNPCYSALRLANGNTLISTGNGHAVIEVTPGKEIVWHLKGDELPGIQLGWVCQLQALKNGNVIITNCHATDKNPQIIEVNRDKKVVWSFKDFKNFGNAVPVSFVIDSEGSIR